MSHGIRVVDIAWQAFQAGCIEPGLWTGMPPMPAAPEQVKAAFESWWQARERQGCALPACAKCGHDPGAKVAASWTILIDRDPPSLNDRLFNAGPRRWAYNRERDAWSWEFRAWRLMRKIPKATGRRRVTLTRVFGGRQQERDPDNLAGGMKSCLDAIVLEGLIVGDASRDAEVHYAQERGSPRGLRVLIEELA